MKLRCDRCGIELGAEDGIYRVEIRVYADLTRSMPFVPPDRNEVEIDELLQKLKDLEASLIEEDVHQEMSFLLCRRCKERFAANPLNLPLGGAGDAPSSLSEDDV